MNLRSGVAKFTSPGFRRDPIRMIVRPVLREAELRRSRRRAFRVRRTVAFGMVLEYDSSEILHRGRYLYGVHEYLSTSIFHGQVTPGSTVLDVGANLGEYTIVAAAAVGQAGAVLAFEPNPRARERLVRNLEINHLDNVQVLALAAGSDDGHGLLRVPEDMGLGTLRSGADGNEYDVEIRSIDHVMASTHLPPISAMKIDVEGWEAEVLAGAAGTVERDLPVVIHESWAEAFGAGNTGDVTPSMTFLSARGYVHYVATIDRRGDWTLVSLAGIPDPIAYRDPWATLMVVSIHSSKLGQVRLQGHSPIVPCGILEPLARRRPATPSMRSTG